MARRQTRAAPHSHGALGGLDATLQGPGASPVCFRQAHIALRYRLLFPFHLSLVLTHACNLACTYCCMGEHHPRAMTTDMAKRAVDLAVLRARESGASSLDIGFFGGEPLLAWATLVAVSEHARVRARAADVPLRLQVTTNGTLLDDARVATLTELGVRTTVSIDGVREAHDLARPTAGGKGSYDAVVAGLTALRRARVLDDVILVMSRANLRHLRESITSLAALAEGGRPGDAPLRVHTNVAYGDAYTDEDLVAWEAQLRGMAEDFVERYGTSRAVGLPLFEGKIAAAVNGGLADMDTCSVGRRNLAVAPSGRLYACDRLVGEDGPAQAPLVLGHLDDGLVVGQTTPRGTRAEECASCTELPRCGSHCACANHSETGQTDLPGPVQCWFEQLVASLADAVATALLKGENVQFTRWIRGGRASSTDKRRLPHVIS